MRSAQDRVQPGVTEVERILLGGSSHGLCPHLRPCLQSPPAFTAADWGSPAKPARPPTISPAHVSDLPGSSTWFPVRLAASLNDPAWLSHTSMPLNGSLLCLRCLPSFHWVHPCSSGRTQLIDATPSKAPRAGFSPHPPGS